MGHTTWCLNKHLFPTRKKIRAQILSQKCAFSNDILLEIIPQKSDVQLAKIATHSGDVITVILHERQPMFFEVSGVYFPTGRCDTITTIVTGGSSLYTKPIVVILQFILCGNTQSVLPALLHGQLLSPSCTEEQVGS